MMKCKVCGSNDIENLFYSINTHGRHIIDNKEKFLVSQCKICSVIFLNNIKVSKRYYSKYYKPGYYDNSGIKENSLLEKFMVLFSRLSVLRKEHLILNYLSYKNKKISILDIGCGKGIFLYNLDSLKFIKCGTEINREGYDLCKKKGLSVFYGDFDEINFGRKKFDVISLWHVLEHIDEPTKLFKNIHQIIKPGGILIFQIPNTECLGFKLGKKNWYYLDSPRHLIHYNNRSIETLCQITGFKIIGIKNEFYEYPLDLFWSVKNSIFKFIIYPLYPIIRLLSKEHLTYICAKNPDITT